MKSFSLSIIVALMLITGATGAAGAKDGPSLRGIMLGLNANMDDIGLALHSDDFKTIETKAMEIANHETPPMAEMKKIMVFLGAEMDAFKKIDQTVHNSAIKLAEAATKKDRAKVVERYGFLFNGCMDCHTRYRDRIVKHLRGWQ